MSNEPAPPFAVERRPDPDAATALAATAAAFLSWYFHVTCGACRRAAYVNHVPFLLDGWAERPVRQVVNRHRSWVVGQFDCSA